MFALSKKTGTVAATTLIALALVSLALGGCGPTPTPQPPPTNPPTNPPQPAPGTVDLILGVTTIQPYNDTYLTYQIVATIENYGTATANGFSAGCTYQCPPGDTMISGGLDIVQGGYLGPNSSHTYQNPFHYMCTARPPTVDLSCTITSPDGSTRTYSVAGISLP